jgi:hypothetical protein
MMKGGDYIQENRQLIKNSNKKEVVEFKKTTDFRTKSKIN